MRKTISLHHCDLFLLSRFSLYDVTSLDEKTSCVSPGLCIRQDKGSATDLTLSSMSLHTDFIFLYLKKFLAQFGS